MTDQPEKPEIRVNITAKNLYGQGGIKQLARDLERTIARCRTLRIGRLSITIAWRKKRIYRVGEMGKELFPKDKR